MPGLPGVPGIPGGSSTWYMVDAWSTWRKQYLVYGGCQEYLEYLEEAVPGIWMMPGIPEVPGGTSTRNIVNARSTRGTWNTWRKQYLVYGECLEYLEEAVPGIW